MRGYRKELKFLCADSDLIDIENRIKTVMKKDQNQIGDSYNIRSIYFDDPYNTCFHENSAGIGTRHKYRIRIYNRSDSFIRAEIKTKYRETITKSASELSLKQFNDIMNRSHLSHLIGHNDTLDRYAEAILGKGYCPAAIVEYNRVAYTYQPCNVRITFDKDICASHHFDLFFEKDLNAFPVLKPGMHVLEIKYDEFLPAFIEELLSCSSLERTSCSKYYLSRLTLGRIYE